MGSKEASVSLKWNVTIVETLVILLVYALSLRSYRFMLNLSNYFVSSPVIMAHSLLMQEQQGMSREISLGFMVYRQIPGES